ncbi:MAG: quinone oxidoreductase [Archangiaceae bacterium]|nr:quinone oxidoreductase [Archangiaceae bacterium]
MTLAIRVHRAGDASVLKLEEVALAAPGAEEVQLAQRAIGINFVDVYNRSGLYSVPTPFTPGQEGAGVVTAVGSAVSDLKVGQRVAYAGPIGAYAAARNLPAAKVVPLPDGIDEVLAASVMLKGMTAEYLVRRCRPVKSGETVLVHAAAGGVGTMLTQWARSLSARVIGAVGSEEKAVLARRYCDAVVLTGGDWVTEVKKLGPVHAVYDSVGKDTFQGSLDVLAPRGTLVSFGQSSGKVPPFDLLSIGGPRSLFVTRPSMHAYTATREELRESAAALFTVLREKTVVVDAPRTFALAQAAEAHRALEGRKTTGALVLLP